MKASEVSRPGPGTSARWADASQIVSPHTTRLVATMAPQAAATRTSRHGSL